MLRSTIIAIAIVLCAIVSVTHAYGPGELCEGREQIRLFWDALVERAYASGDWDAIFGQEPNYIFSEGSTPIDEYYPLPCLSLFEYDHPKEPDDKRFPAGTWSPKGRFAEILDDGLLRLGMVRGNIGYTDSGLLLLDSDKQEGMIYDYIRSMEKLASDIYGIDFQFLPTINYDTSADAIAAMLAGDVDILPLNWGSGATYEGIAREYSLTLSTSHFISAGVHVYLANEIAADYTLSEFLKEARGKGWNLGVTGEGSRQVCVVLTHLDCVLMQSADELYAAIIDGSLQGAFEDTPSAEFLDVVSDAGLIESSSPVSLFPPEVCDPEPACEYDYKEVKEEDCVGKMQWRVAWAAAFARAVVDGTWAKSFGRDQDFIWSSTVLPSAEAYPFPDEPVGAFLELLQRNTIRFGYNRDMIYSASGALVFDFHEQTGMGWTFLNGMLVILNEQYSSYTQYNLKYETSKVADPVGGLLDGKYDLLPLWLPAGGMHNDVAYEYNFFTGVEFSVGADTIMFVLNENVPTLVDGRHVRELAQQGFLTGTFCVAQTTFFKDQGNALFGAGSCELEEDPEVAFDGVINGKYFVAYRMTPPNEQVASKVTSIGGPLFAAPVSLFPREVCTPLTLSEEVCGAGRVSVTVTMLLVTLVMLVPQSGS